MYLFLEFKLQRIHKLSRIISRIYYENIHVHIICSFAARQENWQHKMVINILEILFIVPKERFPWIFKKDTYFCLIKDSTSSWFWYKETVCAIFLLLFYTYLVQYMQCMQYIAAKILWRLLNNFAKSNILNFRIYNATDY